MKNFITCSKFVINELGRYPTRSDSFHFANNELQSIPVFTAAFRFVHAEQN